MRVSPVLTAVWFIPLVAGGVCLAIVGGWILRLFSGSLLMVVSCLGFALSMALFVLIPVAGDVSTGFTYWAYVFPAMLGSTIGVDIAFNVSNIFITTKMPRKLQTTASGMISSLLYLGIAFWLGIAELAVTSIASQASEAKRHASILHRVPFIIGLCLTAVALCITLFLKIEPAIAEETADEKKNNSSN